MLTVFIEYDIIDKYFHFRRFGKLWLLPRLSAHSGATKEKAK